MDLGTVMTVAQTVFAALQCKELKEICSVFGYKSQLDDLKKTVITIQAVLRDADTKEELSNQAQLWIQELKDAVYDADDLLDEFVTLARRKELVKGGKVTKKARLFFSRCNPLGVANKMSQGVKKIRKNLDAIAKNHEQFGFKVNSEPIRRRREETCSYVYENTIVGREDDVEKILGHLLDDSNVKQDVSFLSIVGIGGLGKTALAQLLYNDPRVTSAFSLKLWTCISDEDQERLDVELVLRKILAAVTGQNHNESTKELLQSQVREKLTSNKYLLVLDDVWTENRSHWLKLAEFLLGGQRGSWIVVTTRSHETAKIVGGALTHELQGLSAENSWLLFKNVAFGLEQLDPHEEFVKIGKEIVEECSRVPLAIRVAGSLLYGQDKSKWVSFKEIGLSKHRECQKDIISILKLSYSQLEFSLKSCFAYCALFPKDSVINKELLINLWKAHDYIVPLDDGQRIEDAAEEYYSILLRRCFFQDVKLGLGGEIVSCKIHDLMHDVAQKVAEKEICISNLAIDEVHTQLRHLAYTSDCKPYSSFFTKTYIRSYLNKAKMEQASLEALLANWMRLRVLDLRDGAIVSLPESIGGLLHLRYLDLSRNTLSVLPKSITKLYNLQTLKLHCCYELKELPKDLRKLVNLRVLDINTCTKLTNMPEGMSELMHLQVLTVFVIDRSVLSQQQWLNQLGELRKLDSLKGYLEVRIKGCQYKNVMEDVKREGAYLRGKKHLNHLLITFPGGGDDEGKLRLLEDLQPHPNLKALHMYVYNDAPVMRMPEWVNNLAKFLPNLASLEVGYCTMEYISCLGYLPHLKNLKLVQLDNLEYIYEDSALAASNELATSTPNGFLSENALVLFPCLKRLDLGCLPKFKGWRTSRAGVGDSKQQQHDNINTDTAQVSLPQLNDITIITCPDLICILLCPNLEELKLSNFNPKLQLTAVSKTISDEKSGASLGNISKLRTVEIDNVLWLNSLPREAFQCLKRFLIRNEQKLKCSAEIEDIFLSCSSSLQTLAFCDCPNLRSIVSGGLEHLMALEFIDILQCLNLSILGEEGEHAISLPWLPSLRILKLACTSQLLDLQNWIPFLVALHTLDVYSCKGLESVPIWMPKLTSLRELRFWGCSKSLKERCQHTTGQDWPYVQHIPQFYIL